MNYEAPIAVLKEMAETTSTSRWETPMDPDFNE